MGQTDSQYKGFLRVVIRDLKDALAAKTPEEKDKIIQALLDDLQSTLED